MTSLGTKVSEFVVFNSLIYIYKKNKSYKNLEKKQLFKYMLVILWCILFEGSFHMAWVRRLPYLFISLPSSSYKKTNGE